MKKKYIVLATAVLVLLAVFAVVTRPKAPPPRILPTPNGYDELLRCVELMPQNKSDPNQGQPDETKTFLQSAEPALKLVHAALQKECLVSDSFAPTNSQHVENISKFKSLAQTLMNRGNLAQIESRNHDAMIDYLDVMRLGAIGLRGGVLIDRMVGIACETMGVTRLKSLVPELSAVECRELLTYLDDIDKKRDSFEMTMGYERDWVERNYPWHIRLGAVLTRNGQQAALNKTKARVESVQLLETEIRSAAATRIGELEKHP